MIAGSTGAGRRERAFTLVELLIATVILLVVLVVGAALAGDASAMWHTIYHDTRAVHDARRGLAAVADELRLSDPAVVTVDADRPEADVLTYQVPVGRTGTTLLWGAEGQQDWRVRVSVSDGRLIRSVLDEGGSPRERDQVLATGVDGLFQNEKGFAVTLQGNLVTLRLRTRARSGGHTWRKTVVTTVQLRN